MRYLPSGFSKTLLGNFFLFLFIVILNYSLGVRPSFLFAPNFLLLFLVFNYLSYPRFYTLFLSFLSGLILDALGGLIWGEYLISFLFIWLIGAAATKIIESKSLFSKLIIGEIQILIFFLCLIFIHLLFHSPVSFLSYLLSYIVNALFFALFMFLLLYYTRRR